MSLAVISVRSPLGQTAKIDPTVKLQSTMEEPSKGSKVTMYLPSSLRTVRTGCSSEMPAYTNPVYFKQSKMMLSVWTSKSS